jgi:hypothetical protein
VSFICSAAKARITTSDGDLRIMLLLGIANWFLFLDHIPHNAVSSLTLRNFGFSGATDLFVFVGGYAAATMYGRVRRTIPRRANTNPKRAFSDASRTSIASCIVTPTPTAGPFTAAITGFRHSKIRSVSRPPPSRTASLLQSTVPSALIADFRINAPHIKVSVVMPGHIGTGIRLNSLKVQANTDLDELDAAQVGMARARLQSMGKDATAISDAEIKTMLADRARRFVTDAPTSAAEAATIIIEGVKADRLRILVGRDAHVIDRMVREDPDHAYDEDFFARFAAEAGWYPGR